MGIVRTLLLLVAVGAGLAAVVVCTYYLFPDWRALLIAYARFEHLATQGADLPTLVAASSVQESFRINCFAEGVGLLLGAILATIGVHGLGLQARRAEAA